MCVCGGVNILSDALGTKPLTELLAQVDIMRKPGLSLLLLKHGPTLVSVALGELTLPESISIPVF